jgi:hypothetical protein
MLSDIAYISKVRAAHAAANRRTHLISALKAGKSSVAYPGGGTDADIASG